MMITSSSSLFILLLQYFFQTCVAKPYCTLSACGIISNISHPFRLKGDPNHCGIPEAELACENNATFLYLDSQKYYVKAINYTRLVSTITLVDASINNHTCSFPTSSAYLYNFTSVSASSVFRIYPYAYASLTPINLMSCPHPLRNSSTFIDTTHCQTSNSRFSYVKIGSMKASDVREMCSVDVMVMTSWVFKDLNNVSLEEIHNSLLYGFQLKVCTRCRMKWKLSEKFKFFFMRPSVFLLIPLAIVVFISAGLSLPVIIIIGFTFGVLLLLISFEQMPTSFYRSSLLFPRTSYSGFSAVVICSITIFAPRLIICPIVVWLLIYKFRRRRLSMFDAIESFLQSDNKLMPIRYKYSDIKKMTKGFQDKLGEGGYGSVYKGKLRSGHHVAVKLLRKSGSEGQDFMNEIATIGRIHHVNVIQLVGYCAEGSKRVLVFDFMPNGSLEKYIFNPEKLNSLTWDTKLDIAIGVARGIEYLHRGCDVQILHFDIKPHNILLDEKFSPKISDFGLAKSCSNQKNTLTLTAARGTIGYVAPELITRSLGRVSNKADVYSFGMLLMEIVSLKRDLKGNDDSSGKYFTYWIYDYFNQGKDIEIAEDEVARKMTIVALWCIQMCPDDRPSMNKVLEMLEGDVERLQIPEHPSQATQILVNEDQTGTTCSTNSTSLLHQDDDLSSVQIAVRE